MLPWFQLKEWQSDCHAGSDFVIRDIARGGVDDTEDLDPYSRAQPESLRAASTLRLVEMSGRVATALRGGRLRVQIRHGGGGVSSSTQRSSQ